MTGTVKQLGMKYYGEGVKAAEEKLLVWDIPDREIRREVINEIRQYLDRVLKCVQSGYTSSFALGYFHTLGKKNDPALNEIIEPFKKIMPVQ